MLRLMGRIHPKWDGRGDRPPGTLVIGTTQTRAEEGMGIHMSNWPDLSFEGNAADRRAYPRFRIDLAGFCSIAGGADIACWTRDLSLGGVALHCMGEAVVGDAVIVSLPQMGLLRGRIVRRCDGGFAVVFEGGHVQRSRIASYLVWLITRSEDSSIEDRRFERIIPFHRIVSVRRGDGSSCTSRIIDVSRSGIAFTTTVPFTPGEAISVGTRPAIVVRVVEGGVAARFDEVLDEVFDATIRF